MKLKNIRIYLPGGAQIFFAIGGVLLGKNGEEIQPQVSVAAIRYDDLFRTAKVFLDNGEVLVYQGFGISYDCEENFIEEAMRKVRKFIGM